MRRGDEWWQCRKCGNAHHFRMTRCPTFPARIIQAPMGDNA